MQVLHGWRARCVGPDKKATRSQLDKLIGWLSYCAEVVYGGRAFMHRIRVLRYRGEGGVARPPHHRIHLNREFLLDIEWWIENLQACNGRARMPCDAVECDIRLDATGDGGLGVFVDGGFVALAASQSRTFEAAGGVPTCSDHPTTLEANHWELYNVVLLLRVFGDYLRGKVVTIVSDNSACVAGVHKMKCGTVDATEQARIEHCSTR